MHTLPFFLIHLLNGENMFLWILQYAYMYSGTIDPLSRGRGIKTFTNVNRISPNCNLIPACGGSSEPRGVQSTGKGKRKKKRKFAIFARGVHQCLSSTSFGWNVWGKVRCFQTTRLHFEVTARKDLFFLADVLCGVSCEDICGEMLWHAAVFWTWTFSSVLTANLVS